MRLTKEILVESLFEKFGNVVLGKIIGDGLNKVDQLIHNVKEMQAK